LTYYAIYFTETGVRVQPDINIGFWVGIAAAVGLVAQIFIPRAASNDAEAEARFLNRLTYVILVVALLVSAYLSYLKFANANAICLEGGRFDCGTVLNSIYSEIGGIPIAILGFALDAIVLALMLAKPRLDILKIYGTLLIFGVVLFGFVYSVYLVYLQAFKIKAYCPWCLTHEALLTLLFAVWARQLWLHLRTE